MRVVNRGVSAAPSFFLKVVFVGFPFSAVRGFQNVIPACESPARSRCSSYYPCMTRTTGQHLMTFAVLARKRARPIYQPGRCQPKALRARAVSNCPFASLKFQVWVGCPGRGVL